MSIDVNLILTVIGILIAFFVGMKAVKKGDLDLDRNDKEKVKEEAYRDGKIDSKLDGISATVNRTENNIEGLKKDIKSIDTRLVTVEQSTKSAHHRIDRIEGGKNESK